MSSISSESIRGEFLDYFQENGHLKIDEAGLLPENDPTLLFINSGMAPLKRYFTGEFTPPAQDLTNAQTCIRTNDIEDVGDQHHGTSFTMLGNWSIGGYAQERAVDLAWGLLTERLGFSEQQLSATYFADDGEQYSSIPDDIVSRDAWSKYLSENKVLSQTAEDNFWGPAGTSGPCGPCTEVFYDRGETYGQRVEGELTEGRDIEIWNAGVFMQLDKDEQGNISPLALRSVDAGAGLERIAMVLQHADSIHEIDKYKEVYDAIRSDIRDTKGTRVVFDHLKTSHLILDSGVLPSNSREGYVVRKLLRRAFNEVNMAGLALDVAIDMSRDVREVTDPTPRAVQAKEASEAVMRDEMKRFQSVLKRSDEYFEQIDTVGYIDAALVFDAHSRGGVPADMFRMYAEKKGLVFPEDELATLEDEHRQKSRG